MCFLRMFAWLHWNVDTEKVSDWMKITSLLLLLSGQTPACWRPNNFTNRNQSFKKCNDEWFISEILSNIFCRMFIKSGSFALKLLSLNVDSQFWKPSFQKRIISKRAPKWPEAPPLECTWGVIVAKLILCRSGLNRRDVRFVITQVHGNFGTITSRQHEINEFGKVRSLWGNRFTCALQRWCLLKMSLHILGW